MSICLELPSIAGPPKKHQDGFTLVELLVAISVLSLMMLFIAQLVSVVGQFSRDGARRADNYTKARATLDAFSRDIRAGVFRSDLAAFTDASTTLAGPAPICFYTGRPGIGNGVRNVSLVVYRIYQSSPTTVSLQRGAMPVLWTDNANTTTPPISFNSTTTLPRFDYFTSNPPEDVADGVVRAGVYFINNDGKLYKIYSPQATVAVGITLAVVDAGTVKVLSASQLSALTSSTGLLPDDSSGTTPNQTLGSYWTGLMATPGFYNGYPQQLRSGLRVFERYIELPTN